MGWSGLYGPPGLPAEVVTKWVEVLKRVAQDPDWIRGNASFGGRIIGHIERCQR